MLYSAHAQRVQLLMIHKRALTWDDDDQKVATPTRSSLTANFILLNLAACCIS